MYNDGEVFLQELEILLAKEAEFHHFMAVPFLLREKRTPDHHHISIIDLKECSTKLIKSGVGRKVVKLLLTFEDKHYPDGAYKVFLVNAPKSFSNIWRMIKRFLSKSITSKVYILENDLRLLLECIDLSELPGCIGGTSGYKLGEYPVRM